ncbi:restriction endonuclease subunit S [Hazenella coriacea]|uniref:Type I restriction enzyme S subunit n=1 Tax=Hazenella coriacea TaxID=1179467 RepID=A0A4R3L585_9BACL|nr:restriction endonuclease subunit S [Hazenella coriacea]TCS93304.1 type I restriction enzyme S subunit [Hazenella coriacea]
MKNRHIPEVRFQGFTGDWEQRKLGDIAEINPKSNLPEQFEYVDLESVVGTDLISHRTEHRESAPSRAQRLAKQGDVFYQTVRPYQKNNYLFDLSYDNYVFSTGYAQMRPNVDSYFLFSKLQEEKFVSSVLDRCTGTSYPAINSKDLAQIEVEIPTLGDEQTKIGNFFKQLDDTIALHQQELTTLKQTKQGFLQKIFPKVGESVPEVRFPGFTGDWEQRRLGGMADFSKGNGYSKSDLTDKGKPIILYGRLYTKYETVIDSVDTFTIEKGKSVISKGDEVIIPSSGETSEDISRASVVSKPGIILGGDLNIVRPSNEIDPVFLALTISNGKQQKELSKRAQGKSVVHLHNSDLKEVNLLFPKKEEQTQIGNFFKQLDDMIALHQRELELLQETKKAFLQKMFV